MYCTSSSLLLLILRPSFRHLTIFLFLSHSARVHYLWCVTFHLIFWFFKKSEFSLDTLFTLYSVALCFIFIVSFLHIHRIFCWFFGIPLQNRYSSIAFDLIFIVTYSRGECETREKEREMWSQYPIWSRRNETKSNNTNSWNWFNCTKFMQPNFLWICVNVEIGWKEQAKRTAPQDRKCTFARLY